MNDDVVTPDMYSMAKRLLSEFDPFEKAVVEIILRHIEQDLAEALRERNQEVRELEDEIEGLREAVRHRNDLLWQRRQRIEELEGELELTRLVGND